jgi:hypothetical protein
MPVPRIDTNIRAVGILLTGIFYFVFSVFWVLTPWLYCLHSGLIEKSQWILDSLKKYVVRVEHIAAGIARAGGLFVK